MNRKLLQLIENLDNLTKDLWLAKYPLEKIKSIKNEVEDVLLHEVEEIKLGRRTSIIDIQRLLELELKKRRSLGEYPAYKKINSILVLIYIQKKIALLKYELALSIKTTSYSKCNCKERIESGFEPKKEFLKRLKSTNPNLKEEGEIYICNNCKRKWINVYNQTHAFSIPYWTEFKDVKS